MSITNVNPTDAVTLHLRYFNQECEDVLDFLVLLTCTDTMLINPFDFTIPSTVLNVKNRFFGELGSFGLLGPMPASVFGDGRFLLMVTASGAVGNDSGQGSDTSPSGDRGDFDDPEDLDDFADWLFTKELVPADLVSECGGVDPNTIGVQTGVNDNNLNVFNASAISFNYLTGFNTLAVIREDKTAAHGVTAWTRPAVNASVDLDAEDSSEFPDQTPDHSPQDVDLDFVFDADDLAAINDGGLDGDGPLAPKRKVLAGSEEIWLTLSRNAALFLPANYFYLRQDAHGGNTIETNCEGTTLDTFRCVPPDDFAKTPVTGGALNWTLFPSSAVELEDQFLFAVSAKDDYNGSNNFQTGGTIHDNSYRLDPAATYYQLSIFNNDEELLVPEDPIGGIPVSPPPAFTPLVTRFGVCCLNARTFEIFNIPAAALVSGGDPTDFVFTQNLGTFSVGDLFNLDGQGLVADFLSEPVPVNDELGPGWIRLDRIMTRDFWYELDSGGNIQGVAVPYDGERGTYVTITKKVLFFESVGAAWYLPLSATDFSLP